MKTRFLKILPVLFLWALTPEVCADGYWGYNENGGSSLTMGPTYCWGNKYSVDWFSPGNNVVIDSFIIWCNGQNNNPRIVFGVYTVSGGVIASLTAISETLSVTGNTMQRWVKSAGVALTSGATYTLCIDIVGSAGPAVAYASQSAGLSRCNQNTFPATWNDNATVASRYSVAAHYYNQASAAGIRRRIIIGGDK